MKAGQEDASQDPFLLLICGEGGGHLHFKMADFKRGAKKCRLSLSGPEPRRPHKAAVFASSCGGRSNFRRALSERGRGFCDRRATLVGGKAKRKTRNDSRHSRTLSQRWADTDREEADTWPSSGHAPESLNVVGKTERERKCNHVTVTNYNQLNYLDLEHRQRNEERERERLLDQIQNEGTAVEPLSKTLILSYFSYIPTGMNAQYCM